MNIRNFIYKGKAFLCLAVILFLTQGCVEDDLSSCGVTVKFTYTKNIEGIDKFDEEVENINLYLFDSKGVFVGEYKGYNNAIALNIFEGTYSLVAWGNICEDFELPSFVQGSTTLDDAVLSLSRTDSIIANKPARLFHGAIYNVKIEPTLQTDQTFTIDMMRDTKDITVTTIGLPVSTKSPGSDRTYNYACTITSINGDYNFDNTIAGSDRLHYIPTESIGYSEDEEERLKLYANFITMRELNDGSTRSKLILTRNEGEIDRVIYEADLVNLLLGPSITNNLDIEHDFTIDLEFDETNGTVTVTVNGWTFEETEVPGIE